MCEGMLTPADLVIEILNESTIGQVNTIDDFKMRSRYWGSRYGVIGSPDQGFRVLVEANHQRWWVREYTYDTSYRIAEGNPNTGQVFVTGIWRCDTYVWWAFYSQGIDLVRGYIVTPTVVFNAFTYGNDERLFPSSLDGIMTLSGINKTLDDVTAEELNDMNQEEFQVIMDAPPTPPEQYITAPMSAYMRLAYDNKLNDTKRGIMIDRLTINGTEPDLVPKLLKLYYETDHTEVKTKIISGLTSYNQVNLRKTQMSGIKNY